MVAGGGRESRRCSELREKQWKEKGAVGRQQNYPPPHTHTLRSVVVYTTPEPKHPD